VGRGCGKLGSETFATRSGFRGLTKTEIIYYGWGRAALATRAESERGKRDYCFIVEVGAGSKKL
jgi:hypothetical protein